MKVIIAGPHRGVWAIGIVEQAVILSGFDITEVVSGQAPGIDTLGEQWANERGIPVKPFPADWTRFGKAAGRIRNGEMAAYAEGLVAIRNGSPGTANMIALMKWKRLPHFVLDVDANATKMKTTGK